MKIREWPDDYDIKSINKIHETVEDIKKTYEFLEYISVEIGRILEKKSDIFGVVSQERIETATADFTKTTQFAQEELLELIASIKKLNNKLVGWRWKWE